MFTRERQVSLAAIWALHVQKHGRLFPWWDTSDPMVILVATYATY